MSEVHHSTNPQGYTLGHNSSATASHSSRTAESDAAFLLPHLKPHFRILDFGCGPGTITSSLCKYVPDGSVVGIDISSKVIAEARTKAKSMSGGAPANLDFRCVDVLRGIGVVLDEPEEGVETPSSIPSQWQYSFDVVYGSQVLVHLSDPVRAICNLKTLLKPDGFIASRDFDIPTMIFSPDPTGKLKRWTEFMSILVTKGGGAPSPYGGRDMPSLFMKSGFEEDQLSISAGTMVYWTDQRAWWGNLLAQRLEQGQDTHDRLVGRCDVLKEECEEVKDALLAWAEDKQGLWFALTIEVLAKMRSLPRSSPTAIDRAPII